MNKISLSIAFCLLFSAVLSQPEAGKKIGELGDYFEGDIILNELQLDEFTGNERNGLTVRRFHWPDKIIPYAFSPDHSKEEDEAIVNALKKIEEVTCVKFIKHTNEQDYVQIINGEGCYSELGHQGGKQMLSLQSDDIGQGCFRRGCIIHEFLHALGFLHMHSSFDRDKYVEINWDNIQENQQHHFVKFSHAVVSHYGTEYDFSSIMQLPIDAYSKNSKPTILPLDIKKVKEMGQRNGLSKDDIWKINQMYKCNM